jgi:hypothetical protein
LMTIRALPTANADTVHIYGRIQQQGGADTFDGYACTLIWRSALADQFQIGHCDNAVVTAVDELQRDFAVGEKIGLRCNGTAIEAWYWPVGGPWTSAVAFTDSTYPNAGKVGFGIENSTWRLDEIYAGPVDPNIAVGTSHPGDKRRGVAIVA